MKILGGGNLHTVCVSDRPNGFQVAGHVRKAVNALARHGDLLKVGSEERHDACARLFNLATARKTDPGVERSGLGLVLSVQMIVEVQTETYSSCIILDSMTCAVRRENMSCCHVDGEPNSTPRKHAIDNSIRVLSRRASAGRIQGGPWVR